MKPFCNSANTTKDGQLNRLVTLAHISWSLHAGGAARAAARMHQALLCHQHRQVFSIAFSARSESEFENHVSGLPPETIRGARGVAARAVGVALSYKRDADNVYSFPLVRTQIGQYVDAADPDWTLIHWIGSQTASHKELLLLSGKKIWYAHDLWISQLTEHLPLQGATFPNTRASILSSRLRKAKHQLIGSLHGIVVPSEHMAERIASSPLTRNVPVAVSPPPLDCDRWQPLDRAAARQALGIGSGDFVVGFAAIGGLNASWKGGRYFVDACNQVAAKGVRVFPLIAGALQPIEGLRIPHLSLGKISRTSLMQLFYAATDVVVCPSSFESFSQVASESHAMGRPVIAFGGSGLDSVVMNNQTGRLVGHSAEMLASALENFARDAEQRIEMGNLARRRAEHLWSFAPASLRLLDAMHFVAQ